jgi:hypothetical protein
VNYLAHGFRYIADPWVVVGTALPDWLRVLARRERPRPDEVRPLCDDEDSRVASFARGVIRHFDDDRRFHGSPVFAATRGDVARELRTVLAEAAGHRPSFIAHVLVEMQLDASLAAAAPGVVDAYYSAVASLDPEEIDAVLPRLLPGRAPRLADLVRRFVAERFIDDYADPPALLRRLDRVVRSVRQPALPPVVAAVLPATRACVDARRVELLG